MADNGNGIADGSSPRKRKSDGEDLRERISILESTDDDVSFNGEINVETPTGEIITVEVKESDTVGSIKVKIQDLEDIPFDQQELVFNKNVLENMDTIANLRVKKESTFTLMRKSNGFINIFIRGWRTTESFAVKPSDTIGNLKRRVFSCPDEEALIFNETVLEDSCTCADVDITDGSTLIHVFKSLVEMDIFVNTYTGKTICLTVNPMRTIEEVKWYIQDEEEGIHRDEHVLIYNNMVLGDEGTLFDFGITKNSTLTLMHRPWEFTKSMRIFIKTLTRETITQEVEPSDAIVAVKAKIQDKVDVPSYEQELIFNEMVLSDINTLADFHIIEESTLTLMHKPCGFRKFMRIFIKTLTGETITQEVKPSNTIGDVKAKIQDKVGVPCDEQELIFNEMVMSNNDTVADFHIKKESTLTLMRKSSGFIRIFVKITNGEVITLNVRPSNTIRDVKSKTHDMGKISLHDKDLGFLSFNDKRLEDSASLADYHIPKESTLHLVRRFLM